jgi:hypothetical protein
MVQKFCSEISEKKFCCEIYWNFFLRAKWGHLIDVVVVREVAQLLRLRGLRLKSGV